MATRDRATMRGADRDPGRDPARGDRDHDRPATTIDSEPELRQVGLKVTHARKRVLEIIRSSPARHLSAEDIYRMLIEQRLDVGMATVYRVLSQLEGAGLLLRHVFDGGRAVFEYDEGVHHDHLICVGCGRVDEFRDDRIEALQREVAGAHGYQLADHRLLLRLISPGIGPD